MRNWINLFEGTAPAGMHSLGRVYHGSGQSFSIIDPSRARSGLGSYATPNREFAEEFGQYVIEGELFARHFIDLSQYGAFVEEDDLAEIADLIGIDHIQLEDTYSKMLRATGDVFMFNLLENCGLELTDGTVIGFGDWGEGSEEPAFVFADPNQFVLIGETA